MKIQADSYVTIAYQISLDDGTTIDEIKKDEPMDFIYGRGQIFHGIESLLEGKEEGQSFSAILESEDAFGDPIPDLIKSVPRSEFPADLELKPGLELATDSPHGPIPFLVSEVKADEVMIDFNHPLAGKRLHFSVEILSVREATVDEILASAQCSCDGHDGGCHSHSDDSCGCHQKN